MSKRAVVQPVIIIVAVAVLLLIFMGGKGIPLSIGSGQNYGVAGQGSGGGANTLSVSPLSFISVTSTDNTPGYKPDSGSVSMQSNDATISTYLGFFDPPVLMSQSDDVKLNAPIKISRKDSLNNYPLKTETNKFIIRFDGQLRNPEPLNVYIVWNKENNDGGSTRLYSTSYDIPPPSSQGYDWWNYYEVASWVGYTNSNQFGVPEIQAEGGNYSVSVSLSNGGGQGTKKYYFTVLPKPVTTPPAASLPDFGNILNKILSWLQSVFSSIQLSISGASSVTPGSTQSYDILILTEKPIDSDYSDGKYAVRYANYALVKKDGSVSSQGTWEQVTNSWSKSVTLTIPTTPQDYVLIGVITENVANYNYDTNTWTYVGEQVISKEAYSIQSEITEPLTPPAEGFGKILSQIFNFIKGLFGL